MVLADLKPGCKGWIKDLTAVNELLRCRLIDLGIMEGTEIRVKQKLPFGGPLTIEAGGQLLGIRRIEAKKIRLVIEQ